MMNFLFYALIWASAFAVWTFLSHGPLAAARGRIEASARGYATEFRRQSDT